MTITIYLTSMYTRSPLEDSRLFGPSPWKVLATNYEQKRFLSNPAPGENLLSGNLVMETGCIIIIIIVLLLYYCIIHCIRLLLLLVLHCILCLLLLLLISIIIVASYIPQ